MVQQITNGVKISVQTNYVGTTYRNYQLNYGFSYQIHIENQSKNTLQLLNRYWEIIDSLNTKQIVEGAGVIGQQPVLKPLRSHSYTSHCFITSPIGAMKGYYTMINVDNNELLKVYVPTFQLMVSSSYN